MTTTESKTAETPAMAPALGGVVPYLCVDGAMKAADFYVSAFGGKIVGVNPPDETGRTMHVHLYINGGSVMLGDGYPEHGCPVTPHRGYNLHQTLPDVDAAWKRALDAGCEIVLPLQLMFWGERYGQVRDPFGVLWSLSQPAK